MGELRMRDLTQRTGLSRQAIHFYVEQGLVDPPEKTGKTMGYYTEAHVERILLVKKLQEEHFLPLKAIRAMLDESENEKRGGFTRAQRTLLADVRARLSDETLGAAATEDIELASLLRRTKVTREDLAELRRLGLVDARGKRVSAEDAWVIELWGEVRAMGFTKELGFGPELLAIYDDGIARIFEAETAILARLATALPASRVAGMVDRALPLAHSFLVRIHERRVRALFASLGEAS